MRLILVLSLFVYSLSVFSQTTNNVDTGYRLAMLGYSDKEISDVLSNRISVSEINFRRKLETAGYNKEEIEIKVAGFFPKSKATIPRDQKQKRIPLGKREERVKHIIAYASSVSGIEQPWIYAIIQQESFFDNYAVSKKNARGLMQLIPDTAKMLQVKDVFSPIENVVGGARYFRYLLDRFDGDYDLALAGYNAGPEKVVLYGGIPPYKETINYVKKVKKAQEKYSKMELAYAPTEK